MLFYVKIAKLGENLWFLLSLSEKLILPVQLLDGKVCPQ